jgi:hypothetical protein
VATAVTAAIAAVEVIFFSQDHQTVFIEIEIDAFNQLFHGVFLSAAPGRVSQAGLALRSLFSPSTDRRQPVTGFRAM